LQEKRLFVIGFGQPAKQRPKAEWGKAGKSGKAERQQQSNNTNTSALTAAPKETTRKKVTRRVANGWRWVGKARYPAMATAVSSGDDLTDFQSQSRLPHFPQTFLLVFAGFNGS